MAGGLVFDAASSNLDGTNPGTALDVYNTASYQVLLDGISWPAPAATIQWASSVDMEGALSASAKHENRQISMTILCKTAAALTDLETKLMKIHREGGTLKWTLRDGTTVIIFDLLSVDTYEPVLDDGLHVKSSGTLTKVRISMTAKPYGRGAEIDLGDNVETTLPLLVFTDTGVKGDVPGLGRLVIDNDDAGNAQRLLRWGIQSRYYSNASTAALFYQGESCAMSAASAAAGPAGASGGGSNTAFYNNLPASPSWTSLISLGASSTAQTHIGSFRVMARVQAAGAGSVSVRAQWRPSIGAEPIANDGVTLPALGVWYLVDLGLVNLPVAQLGSQGWIGLLQANSTVAADDIYVDWIAFFPVDEGYGEDLGQSTSPQIAASGGVTIKQDGAFANVSGGYNTRLVKYEGDYLFIPPAGAEARTVRVIVKLSRGDIITFATEDRECVTDPGIDDLSARLFYTPRYLAIPAA